MVINSHRREVFVVAEYTLDYRITFFSSIDTRLTPELFNGLNGKLDAFSDIVQMLRVHGDGWRFDKTTQKFLEFLSMLLRECKETFPA